MGMCYLPDGTGEMIFDVYGAWRVVEERCGSDIVSEIKNSIDEETYDREIKTFETVRDVRIDLFNLIEELEPLSEKEGVTGKLFQKLIGKLQKINSDLRDAQNNYADII